MYYVGLILLFQGLREKVSPSYNIPYALSGPPRFSDVPPPASHLPPLFSSLFARHCSRTSRRWWSMRLGAEDMQVGCVSNQTSRFFGRPRYPPSFRVFLSPMGALRRRSLMRRRPLSLGGAANPADDVKFLKSYFVYFTIFFPEAVPKRRYLQI